MKYSYKLIAKFDYNDKQYLIILVNKKKIVYAIYKDKILSLEISRHDLDIFNFVYKSLKIDTNKSINLGIKEIDGKKFDIFYDKEVCLHYWYEIRSNKRYEANAKDNFKLNFKYNNIPTVYYKNIEELENIDTENNKDNENILEDNNKFINRVVKLGKKALFVMVSAGISLTAIANLSVANQYYDSRTKNTEYGVKNDSFGQLNFFEIINQKQYDFDDIKKAIKDNKNLTDSEKEFLYKLKFVFDENYKYMNLELILDRLSGLEIEYIKDNNESRQIVGMYCINDNKIKIYGTESLEDANLSDFLHEFFHVLQEYGTNRLTLELTNELTTREVLRRMNEMGLIEDNKQFLNNLKKCSNYGNGYEPCMRVEYLFADLLSKETIQAYQFGCTDDILVNALLEIDEKSSNSRTNKEMEERAYKLLDSIDDLLKYDENGNKDIDYTDEKYKEIYNQIDYYYKAKNGISMEETLKSDIFKYDFKYISIDYGTSEESIKAGEETLLDEVPSEMHNEEERVAFDFYKYVLPKTYLSDIHPNAIIMFGFPETVEIEITDELDNRYKENYKKYREKLEHTEKNYEYEIE